MRRLAPSSSSVEEPQVVVVGWMGKSLKAAGEESGGAMEESVSVAGECSSARCSSVLMQLWQLDVSKTEALSEME